MRIVLADGAPETVRGLGLNFHQHSISIRIVTRQSSLRSRQTFHTPIMSDNGNDEVEVQNPAGNIDVLPKEVTAEIGSVKLFNKWSYEDVEIRDISLTYDIRARRGDIED